MLLPEERRRLSRIKVVQRSIALAQNYNYGEEMEIFKCFLSGGDSGDDGDSIRELWCEDE